MIGWTSIKIEPCFVGDGPWTSRYYILKLRAAEGVGPYEVI